MAENVAENVTVTSGVGNSYELLSWLNETLQTDFTKLEQVCSGAAYCQLMDWLYPGSLNLSRVRFQSSSMADTIHNYSLLQGAFRKIGVVRFIPTEALMKKNRLVARTFLQWFQLFFNKNNKDREYHPLEARGGQSMVPDSDDQSHRKVEIIVKTDGKTAEEPRKEKPRENLKMNSDVIVLISDEDDVMEVTMKQTPEKMETKVKEECAQEQQIKKEENAEATAENGNQGRSLYTSDTLLPFIRKYCGNDVDTNSNTGADASVPPILSPTHPKDIIQTCYRTPYCLYLYVGVELDGGQTTSVILIGYLDQSSGVSLTRLLHTLQMRMDTDPQSASDMDTDCSADSDARLLIETLKKFSLPLSNMAAFYCDAPHPVSKVFVSQLQAFSPRMVSLCGLPGMAGRACQAGLLASFGYAVDLIRDIHHHFSIHPSDNVCLEALIADTQSFNPSHPVSAQCSLVISTVQNMVSIWQDLVRHFKSLRQGGAADQILLQLIDHKVKLAFLFLSHALEPLRTLQDAQQNSTVDVVTELRLTSTLAHTYAAGVLRPTITGHFLRTWDVNVLHNEKELRLTTEVVLGPRARDFMLSSSMVDLGEEARMNFLRDATAFYKTALLSVVEDIPEHLGDVALRNISDVLKHPENVYCISFQRSMVSDLGVQLGLCNSASPEGYQLEYEYFSVIKTIKKEEMSGTEKGHCWVKMLPGIRPYSILRRFLLTLLALPSSVSRTQVFDKVFNNSKETSKASPKPGGWAGRPRVRRRVPVQAGYGGIKKEDDDETSTEDSDSSVGKPSLHIPNKRNISDSDYTDNSSDVVDVTEESKMFPTNRQIKGENETPPRAEVEYIVSDDDDGVSKWTPPKSERLLGDEGELVWGKVQGFSPWPAIIVPWKGENQPLKKRIVEWYGQRMSSQVSTEALKPFANFAQNFCSNSFAILDTYREAIFLSLQEAAVRCDKQFSARPGDREDLLKRMLDWACGGFKPTGPEGFKPLPPGVTKTNKKTVAKKSLFQNAASPPRSASSSPMSSKSSVTNDTTDSKNKLSRRSTGKKRSKGGWSAERGKQRKGGCEGEKDDSGGGSEKGKAGWGRGKVKGGWKRGKKSSLMDGFDNDASPDYVPNKRSFTKNYNKINQASSTYTQPDQKLREETIRKIMDTQLDIEGFCLCCGTENVEIFHPLFKGSLCLKCKDNFAETLYRYDEDGYQSYCTICCYGMEVLLCGSDSCCRSYCQDCLNILVGAGTFESLKLLDPWICYLCQPHRPHGALIPREDWSIRVQGLFANNSAMEFEPHRVYPSIPANMRRPIRVLSLFDGIATGYLVLKELGFKVEKYVASEVCEDSIAVAAVNHDEKIIHVGDARFITEKHLEQWGPFDLLIGGSPCNDLSIVNPLRKGLYEGTGRLFFEFYRILQLLKPKEGDPRLFFWLFENVVFMNTHDKVNICRFLECNPVLVDAVRVSPAHRARYFWGNIPGMSRPIIASQSDKLCLQDCLEIGREARVTKVRTITTNSNSLKQGKNVSLLPVLYNGKEDNLWITELEKIFGFPKHYTDVRNMNRQLRQKVLGKAWSVPVIRHLFAPLKDYFACEELPPLTNSNSSTSSTNPPSPASQ